MRIIIYEENKGSTCSYQNIYPEASQYIFCPADVNIWGSQRYYFDQISLEKVITYNNSNIKYNKEKTYLFKNEVDTVSNSFDGLIQNFKTYPCAYALITNFQPIFGYDISILSIKNAEVFVYSQFWYMHFSFEKALYNEGDTAAVNTAHNPKHGSYAPIVVNPKTI